MRYIYHKMFFLCFFIASYTRDKLNAAIVAASFIGGLFLLNIIYFSSLTKIWKSKSIEEILIVFLILVFLNIFYFLKDKRYLSIIENYRGESRGKRISSILIFILYILFTLVSPIFA